MALVAWPTQYARDEEFLAEHPGLCMCAKTTVEGHEAEVCGARRHRLTALALSFSLSQSHLDMTNLKGQSMTNIETSKTQAPLFAGTDSRGCLFFVLSNGQTVPVNFTGLVAKEGLAREVCAYRRRLQGSPGRVQGQHAWPSSSMPSASSTKTASP